MQGHALQTVEEGAEKVAEKTGALQKRAGNLAHAVKPVNRSLFCRKERKRLRHRDPAGLSSRAGHDRFFSQWKRMERSRKKGVRPVAFLINSSVSAADHGLG